MLWRASTAALLAVVILWGEADADMRSDTVLTKSAARSYQLGEEELDGVCTSLDGPRCNPVEKAQVLAKERARVKGNFDAKKKAAERTVKTVKDFVFEGGREVSNVQTRQIQTEDGDILIVNEITMSEGSDDIEGILEQLNKFMRGMADADAPEGDPAGASPVAVLPGLGQGTGAGGKSRHMLPIQDAEAQRPGASQPAKPAQGDSRDASASRTARGEVGEGGGVVSGNGHKKAGKGGGTAQRDAGMHLHSLGECGKTKIGSGLCRLGDEIFRCTKLEGNPLAHSKATAPCKSGVESLSSCLTGEVLCPVQSASSLSEFSSPEPCVYEYKPGFVPDDARHDILVADMSWAQAKAFCDGTTECSSFTFESANSRPTRPETVWFKRISYTDSSGKGWHTYIKKCPQPSTNRFSYLDELDRTALQWLEGELEEQLNYVKSLNMKAGGRVNDKDGGGLKGHQTVMAEVLGVAKNGKMPMVTQVNSPEELASLMKRTQAEQGGEMKSDKEYLKSAQDLFKAVQAQAGTASENLSVGSRVLARWKGGDFFAGKVTAKNSDGTLAVQFDDGDFDKRVPAHHVKLDANAAGGNKHASKATKPASTVRQLVNMMERMLNNTLGGGK